MPTVTSTDGPGLSFAELLREAMDDQDVSARGLARLLAAETGHTFDTDLRTVKKYLAGTVPKEPRARLLERLLHQSAGSFVTARGVAPRLADRLAAIQASVNEIRRELAARPSVDELLLLERRLEEVAATVERLAAETAVSLAALEARTDELAARRSATPPERKKT